LMTPVDLMTTKTISDLENIPFFSRQEYDIFQSTNVELAGPVQHLLLYG
jgi:hypothetical protein